MQKFKDLDPVQDKPYKKKPVQDKFQKKIN